VSAPNFSGLEERLREICSAAIEADDYKVLFSPDVDELIRKATLHLSQNPMGDIEGLMQALGNLHWLRGFDDGVYAATVGDDRLLGMGYLSWLWGIDPEYAPPAVDAFLASPEYGSAVQDLAIDLLEYGEAHHNVMLLNASVALMTGVGLPDESQPRQTAGHSSNLSNALRLIAEMTDSAKYAEMAVVMAEKASALATTEERGPVLTALISALATRFDITGEYDDLDEAIRAGNEARTLLTAEHPATPVALINLVNALNSRSRHNSSEEDVDSAIEIAEDLVRTVLPPDSRHRGTAF